MLFKKFFILLFLTIFWGLSDVSANGEIPNYYPRDFVTHYEISKTTDIDMKELLHSIITDFHVETERRDEVVKVCDESSTCYSHKGNFSYKQARVFLFGELHLEKDKLGFTVKDLYCGKNYYKEDGIGKNKIPNATKMNCEHTWPQSKFSRQFPKNTQKVDLHHLYPVNSRSNSSRNNHIFSEVNGRIVNADCYESKIGYSKKKKVTAFEPPISHRGNVARAMFYFSTRYSIKIDSVQEFYFRKWHKEDPVDKAEIKRNNLIFKYQKNRNPFIDLPNLVSMIDNF